MRGINMGVVLMAGAVVSGVASADSVEVQASKDNTLYESTAGGVSNGAGAHFFAGRTSGGSVRRGLIEFDVAGAIPAGSTINAATLALSMSRTIAGPEQVELRIVLREWGEGGSNAGGQEGGGAPATNGDATWVHAVYDAGGGSVLWTNVGGDFAAAASDVQSVFLPGSYTWSSAAMAGDVQGWLDDPASNHGWMLLGNEENLTTTKRFDSRESLSAASRPKLIVDFSPPAPCPADLNGDEVLDFFDVQAFLQAFAVMDPVADFTNDGEFNFFDVQAFLQAFSAGCP